MARELQNILDGVWLRLGVDTLLDSAPPAMSGPEGLEVTADGDVNVGADFAVVEDWWMAGIAAMVDAGARVAIENNFISGPSGQRRWQAALAGTTVGWAGIRCDPAVAVEGSDVVAIASRGWRPSRHWPSTKIFLRPRSRYGRAATESGGSTD